MQESDEEEAAEKEGGAKQRPGADKRKLADAFEREKNKKERAKEIADKKARATRFGLSQCPSHPLPVALSRPLSDPLSDQLSDLVETPHSAVASADLSTAAAAGKLVRPEAEHERVHHRAAARRQRARGAAAIQQVRRHQGCRRRPPEGQGLQVPHSLLFRMALM